MKMTTLCYVERDENYLMLHRISKKNDANKDKWIGIGGKFEDKESPEDCLLREVYEETGLTLTDYALRGIVTFTSDRWETEYMYLYTATGYEGEMKSCDEGVLEWVPIADIGKLNLWQGDLIFFRLLAQKEPFFSLKLTYEGETLVAAALNGKAMDY